MMRVLLFSLFLAGCATAAPPRAATVLCPVAPVPYTLVDEHALKAEYDALPDTSQLKRWIRDYIAERATLRACTQS
jgi:hypothetical protein